MRVLGLRVGLPETRGDLNFWTSDVNVAFRLTLERMSFFCWVCDGVTRLGGGRLQRLVAWVAPWSRFT